MLTSILVGLDGSPHANAATELGLRWAKRFDAMLVGLTVVPETTLTAPDATPLGAVFIPGEQDTATLTEARHRADGWLEQFSLKCTEAGVSSKVLQDVGDPVDRIALQAQRYDLILLGQTTCFRSANPAEPDDTLAQLLHNPPRPVIAVPETLPADSLAVVVAYDGSIPSARALAGYLSSGLPEWFDTHIVTVGSTFEDAARIADRAVDYLTLHSYPVFARPLEKTGNEGERILAVAEELNAQMLVMGAFGHSALYKFFFGSTTRRVLTKTRWPVFFDH